MMTIREVMEIVDGKVLIGEERLDTRVDTACGSDLMSDVLAFVKEKTVLITKDFKISLRPSAISFQPV